MGLFKFECEKCGDFSKILRGTKKKDVYKCPSCGKLSKRIYNPPNMPIVYEVRDKYRGTKVRQDLMRQLVKRSHEHALTHEADDVINKHGFDAAKKAGFLNEKGSKKTVFEEK